MSLASLLSIARSALATHQRAIETASHNVANAQTQGYSRQRAELVAMSPEQTPWGTVGRGVTDLGIARARDAFLDDNFRNQSGLLQQSTTLQDLLGRIEATIGEPSDTGLAAALDDLFSAFGDLANDPAGATPRGLVQQNAQLLVQQFRRIDGAISDAAREAAERLRSGVADVNALAGQVADLNRQILELGGPLRRAPDLEDQRDRLLDRLAELVGARTLRRDNGSVAVIAGNTVLVDGGFSQPIQLVSAPGGGFGVGLANGGGTMISLGSGALRALSDVTTTYVPAYRARLDALAAGLVSEVNAIHRTGTTPAGATNTDFFDPAGTTAGTIKLAPAVAASRDAIAAGATNAPGDGAVALQLAQLRTTGVASFGGQTIGAAYDDLVALVGVDVRVATQSAQAHDILVAQADTQRLAVSGVSIDEELTNLIAQQQAFIAASKLVSVADEMAQTVLQMV